MDGLKEFLIGILQIPPLPEDQVAKIKYHLELDDGTETDLQITLQQNEVKQILRILFFAAQRTQRDLPLEYDREQAIYDRMLNILDNILEDLELNYNPDSGYKMTDLQEMRRLAKDLVKKQSGPKNIDLEAVVALVKRKAPGVTRDQVIAELEEELKALKAKV